MSQNASLPAPAVSGVNHLRIARILLVALELALLVLVIRQFAVESHALLRVAVVASIGFLIHSFLPMAFRLRFFVLLSLAGIFVVFEGIASAWLVGLGLSLVGVCHLPVSLRARIGLTLSIGAFLALARGGLVPVPWPVVIWPILGSMFMFRLIVYFFDRSHEREAPSVWQTLSYFFLLPNVVFALFPVVDYRTFLRTYYNDEDYRIYQTGVQWMLRGVVHLLLYRLVYYHLLLAPTEVDGLAELAQFLLSNFGLYLHVSGAFHLAVGMLHLFGFNLPETNYLYVLSSSVNDFWRRINIYWKDFMIKVFYYPCFFRLRKRGATRALVVSTVCVVVVTWFLHSYQWFWLRGSFPIQWQDAVFWGTLGVLMIFNSLYESRSSKARGRRARAWTLRSSITQGLAIAGTFTFILLLWSLWTVESLDQWISLFAFLRKDGGTGAAAGSGNLGLLTASFFLFAVVAGDARRGKLRRSGSAAEPSFLKRSLLTLSSLIAILLLGMPAINSALGARTSEIVESLKSSRLNRLDAAQLQRGYYENLLDVARFNEELFEHYRERPKDWIPVKQTEAARPTGDMREYELLPGADMMFKGARFTTNRWGMRDRDYEKVKPSDVYRIGIIGGSYGMGPGVPHQQTFEQLVEDRLNQEFSDSETRYEVLNFSVGGYFPIHRLAAVVDGKLLDFDLDVLIYLVHENERDQTVRRMKKIAEEGLEIPYPFLEEALERAGYQAGVSLPSEAALADQTDAVLEAIYREIVAAARARGVEPVWLLLPTVAMIGNEFDTSDLALLAREAGFSVLELDGVYRGYEATDLRLAPWDLHPNALGHQLIADRLYSELAERSRAAWAPGRRPVTGAAAGSFETGPED